MKLDLTDIPCALIILSSSFGLLYLLNADFEHFVKTDIQPGVAAWSSQNLPTWGSIKHQFMEGYQNGKSAHPHRQK
jgi:hypothetical protein